MPSFIPGLELNKQFFISIVKPILEKNYPNLKYSAARIGYGSDVLGYDTERSTDHDWGLRLEIFLEENDYLKLKDEISNCFTRELPRKFKGYPTNFGDPDEKGVRVIESNMNGLINHRIEFHTINSFFNEFLGINPFSELSDLVWLSFPEQRLLAVTSGEVFHDGLLQLSMLRMKFSYYPDEVWLYLMMRQWEIIAEEIAFPGRAAELEDELGLQFLITNQIMKLMKLCFMLEKKYAPYSKWFGTAFTKLDCGLQLSPLFKNILSESEWDKKQTFLIKAYSAVASIHNHLKITDPVEIKITPFFDRPYLIINARDFANAIKSKISSSMLLKNGLKIGSIDQITNETFILEDISLAQRIIKSFERTND